MNYIVKTMDGDTFAINELEYQGAIKGDGFLVFRSCGVSIMKSRIESIFPEQMLKPKVDRMRQLEGVTPEGEVVIKRFGRWYYRDVNAYQRDDNGQSILAYEGEQLLPTPQEYELDFKQLAPEAWRSALIGRTSEVDDRLLLDRSGRTTQGFEKIGMGREADDDGTLDA